MYKFLLSFLGHSVYFFEAIAERETRAGQRGRVNYEATGEGGLDSLRKKTAHKLPDTKDIFDRWPPSEVFRSRID